MRRSRVIFLFLFVALFGTMLAEAQPNILISSSWRMNPVILDGGITNGEEWSEAFPVDLQLALEQSSETVNARIWVVNDQAWLYLLYRIEWPAGNYSAEDVALIVYVWSFNGTSSSDIGGPRQDGLTLDGYGIEGGGPPLLDTEAFPPGENNVEGAGTYDGTYYWFEFRKELDSRDGYDWALQLGKVYGLEDGSDYVGGDLFVGLRDMDINKGYWSYVELRIASPTVGGNIIEINPSNPTTPFAVIFLVALVLATGFITVSRRKRQLRNQRIIKSGRLP